MRVTSCRSQIIRQWWLGRGEWSRQWRVGRHGRPLRLSLGFSW